jgi:drug/metabolite transporter (DMT)-like permease
MAYGAIVLLVISVMSEDSAGAVWSPLAVGTVVYLAVAGSIVAFVVYYTLLRHVPASSIALVAYVVPIVAVTLGYLILGETLTRGQIVGAAAIVVGVATATGRVGRAPEPPTLE